MWPFKHVWLLVICAGVAKTAPGDRLIVNITDGSLSGVEGRTDEQNIIFWDFLGIPYAAPPVDNLRFQPPQPVKPWSGVRDASYSRSKCTQDNINITGSEDCLYLNVYTTVRPESNSTRLPVMFFIHGGAFVGGSGDIGQHGADKFLNNGVLLVTINYRLGIFGFLCTLDTASPGNYGLKDQIAALKWVQSNIAAFGGDPNQVTIFGESAGAASVQYLVQSSLTKGLYRAAIAESGSSINSWAAAQSPRILAFRVGLMNYIFTLDSNDLVNRLRQIDFTHLQATSSGVTYDLRDNWNGLPWSPCLENRVEGAVVTNYNYEQLQYGDFNRVSIMAGYNSNEARDFSNLLWLYYIYSIEFTLIPQKLVPRDMNAVDTYDPSVQIRQYYFNNSNPQNNSAFIHYASDTLFVRGIQKTIKFESMYTPAYLYRFSFTGGATHKNFTPEGVSHAEELQFLFNLPQFKQTTPDAILTQQRMLKLWTNFAKYRNPTPTPDPLLGNVKWPVANSSPNNLTYLDIGYNLVVGTNPQYNDMSLWDNLYMQYGFEPFNTY